MIPAAPPRRLFLAALAAGLCLRPALADVPRVQVWKDPNCGCCADWIAILRAEGMVVAVTELDPAALQAHKSAQGITPDLASCHTARVAGYVIEGHVPPADIRRLLEERPDALGLSVPGMPWGSPGMGPETTREAYDVRLILRGGGSTLFTHYPAARQAG